MTGIGGSVSSPVLGSTDRESTTRYDELTRKLAAAIGRIEAIEADLAKLGKGREVPGTAPATAAINNQPTQPANCCPACHPVSTDNQSEDSSTERPPIKNPLLGKSLPLNQKPAASSINKMSGQNNQNGGNAADPADPKLPLPPIPVPPAIPPVLNPNGIHFQPQVPSTQFGPITQTYIPRRDPPMGYIAGPMPGYPQVIDTSSVHLS
ncbi:hypothetical protein B0T21DRAFT_154654 [Apiosordaria backusii]|uniref:Uncharacterized protein n=1 Tax=Apiosordaria backusii TaxID=314023 RepID=A0AA40BML1_9PEZI|nr:hypothetical protein B0T21DRAFT_154654 [Apiosordaria backusii]